MLLQGTDEWRQERCGSVGSSDAPRAVRRIKSGGYSADRDSLITQKVVERLTGVPVEIPKTFAMQEGTRREPDSRLLYSIIKNVEVEQVGLVPHPLIAGAHASPDGFVGARGLVELKNPQIAAHLETLTNEVISQDYFVQMQWQMGCTGRDWCDYVSYHPAFPTSMQMWTKRVARDAKFIGELESEIRAVIREVERKVEQLSRRYGRIAA